MRFKRGDLVRFVPDKYMHAHEMAVRGLSGLSFTYKQLDNKICEVVKIWDHLELIEVWVPELQITMSWYEHRFKPANEK